MHAHHQRTIGETFARAMQAYEAGKSGEARRLTRKLVQDHPEFGGGHYLAGLLALEQGHARRAAASLARAIAITPGQPVLHLAMGRALEMEDETAQAVLHYRTVLSLDPGHAEAHARLAELLGRMGRHDEAIGHARSAIAANPAHAEAWNTLGALELRAGRPEKAAEALRRALEIRPDWPGALNNFGVALTDLGRFDQAIPILEGAVELMPSKAAYRANLAAALRLGGKPDHARTQAERATRIDPRSADAWTELGLARQVQDHHEGAAAAFDRAVTLAPRSVSAHYGLAEACRRQGDLARAASCYRKCLDLDPEDRHGAAMGLALVGEAPPPAAPPAYVRTLFDDYADSFERSLVGGLGYCGPEVLAEALGRVLGPASGLAVLDCGCGTGLMGEALKPMAARLDGFDLSPSMVAKTRERGLYDHVDEGELVEVLAARPKTYDVVIAADVLVYVGDLEPVMRAARGALREGGAFAFSTEKLDEAGGTFDLGPKCRYRHTPDYVRATAEAAGFRVALLEDAALRREAGNPDPHMVVVLVS